MSTENSEWLVHHKPALLAAIVISLNYLCCKETKVKSSFWRITFITLPCDYLILFPFCLTVGTMGTKTVSALTYCLPFLPCSAGKEVKGAQVFCFSSNAAAMAECGHLKMNLSAQALPAVLLPKGISSLGSDMLTSLKVAPSGLLSPTASR